ncbi:MAG: MFS transporter, partial [Ruminiclostridium sp.]|nr:MFS transporter [Ruminiclostridium sp.]
MEPNITHRKGFLPYASAAFLIGIVGGFSTVLGPSFVQDIGIAYNNTTWTALAQAMSTAACAPILGKAGDVIGRRTTLLWGIGVFTLGNLLSALANSLLFMLLARFVVGLGTAAMTPVIMAYIVTQFPQDQAAKGFALYMLISSASVILGPSLGGQIIESFGWRAMLWVCVAICVATFVFCLTTARGKGDHPHRTFQTFDWSGAILVVVFFSLLLCIPSFGQNFGWTSWAFGGVTVAAVISLLGLIRAERKAFSPVL